MTSYLTRTTNNFWTEKHTVYLWILINDYYEKIPLKINGKYIQESIYILQELIRRYHKAIITNSEVKYFEEETEQYNEYRKNTLLFNRKPIYPKFKLKHLVSSVNKYK